jgi:cytochrome c-type biogenesis protein CcmF
MEYISSLYLPGAVATWCALFFSLASVWGYSLVLRGDATAVVFARRAYRFFALSVVLAAAVLGVLLLLRDFRIEYVYQYSGMELPFHYQIAAFWAGQKGSFLIWLLWGALIGLPLIKSAGKQEAPVMAIYTSSLMLLLLILVRESPFVMLPETPTDGAGLNPLLQDDWMVIHPPIMFVGYALSAVPFAFAMSALWRRDYDGWARRAFPWALAGFLILGGAIMLGGYWAYETLGWGGYWGWDPVENASLIPWLLGTALIHGLYMERVKGRYRRANYVLSALVYLSVLYGTFLTRSGVLADFSVHSFVDLGITVWLVGGMAVFGGLALVLAPRLKEVPTQPNEDPLLSRGTFIVLSTIVVLISALMVTFGTSAPLITQLPFFDNPAQVGPEFYNTVHFPLAVLVAFLLTLIPFLTWKGESPGFVARKLRVPSVLSAVGTGIAFWAGVHGVLHLLFVFLALLALITNLGKTLQRAHWHDVFELWKKTPPSAQAWKIGTLLLTAVMLTGFAAVAEGFSAPVLALVFVAILLVGVLAQFIERAGGYLAHVGVGVILIGFLASSAYDESTKVTLTQGEPAQVGDAQLTFTRFIPRQGREKERMEVEVVRGDGEKFFVYPKLFVNDRTRQVMANPDIRTTLLHDFYVSPIDYDPGQPAGAPVSFQLAKGEAHRLGDVEIRFVGFQLSDHAQVAMASGAPITVGAALEVTTPEGTQKLMPQYTFSQQNGQADAPVLQVPGSGFLRIGGINAGDGAVVLETAGIGPTKDVVPAKLSIDVTRKPLIALVWWGLFIILFGGLLAIWQRIREAWVWEHAPATVRPAQPPAGGGAEG